MQKNFFKPVILALSALTLLGGVSFSSGAADQETAILLSDEQITVNDAEISTDPADAVYAGAEIIYYRSGQDSSYGAGSASDGHSEAEAAAHTVVTITQPGTYRISGTLSCGQIAIDLGSDAPDDPEASVTLILDNASVTCTVAPALIFYNVWESGDADVSMTASLAKEVTQAATGANVILADGSTNSFTGSHVAKIYKTGSTKKLHKYDGAFYSKRSLTISGEQEGTGTLNIQADNEGLDSELHLNINGGNIHITSRDDGINTNEDNVSVTTINGGILTVNAGNGSEGDGIDSNGYLIINGGEVYSMANGTSPDGGIDADCDILINGGTVVASGTRNDAVSTASEAPFLELTYASTQAGGKNFKITTSEGEELFTHAPSKQYQSLFFTCPELAFDTTYYVYADGIRQQYTGNSTGGMGGGPGGGPGGGGIGGGPGGGDMGGGPGGSSNASTDFIITTEIRSFSGVSDSSSSTGKTEIFFRINEDNSIADAETGSTEKSPVIFTYQGACDKEQNPIDVPAGSIQMTVTDVPSEDYYAACLLSDGEDAVSSVLPVSPGHYCLTLTVLGSNTLYSGTGQWYFSITEAETVDPSVPDPTDPDKTDPDKTDPDKTDPDKTDKPDETDTENTETGTETNNGAETSNSDPSKEGSTGTGTTEETSLSVGSTFTTENAVYTVASANTAKLTKALPGKNKKFSVPAAVTVNKKTLRITAVGKNAFKNCKALTSIVLGKNITVIEAKAFLNCKKLQKIVIRSKKVKKIGTAAFKNIKRTAVFRVPSAKKGTFRRLLTKRTGFGQKMNIR